MNSSLFSLMFIIVSIFIGIVFIFVIAMFISPKFRGKMMSRQIKAQKYMMDESREDIKSISNDMAYATKDGIKITANAIKEGFTGSSVFCKHCGNEIDADSKYCKNCGKEQYSSNRI